MDFAGGGLGCEPLEWTSMGVTHGCDLGVDVPQPAAVGQRCVRLDLDFG